MRSTTMLRLHAAEERDARFFGESIAVAEVAASMIRSVALRVQILAYIRERRLSFSLDPDGLLWVHAGALRLYGVPLIARGPQPSRTTMARPRPRPIV